MYTEYVFADKKYEVASKYLKSILFDIVNEETSKLADIREKIAEADESDLRNKMIELCNRHEINILSILDVSKELNSTLQTIDSFSKEISSIENESLAEIVSNYVEQQKSLAAEQQNVNEVKQQNINEVKQQNIDEVKQQNINEVDAQDVNEEDSITDAVESQNVQTDVVEAENVENNEVKLQNGVVSDPVVSEQSPELVEPVSTEIEPELVDEKEVSNGENTQEGEQNVESSDESVDVPVIESSTPVFPIEESKEKEVTEESVPDIFGVSSTNENEAIIDSFVTDVVKKDSDQGDLIVDEQSDTQELTSSNEVSDNQEKKIIDEQNVNNTGNENDVKSVGDDLDSSEISIDNENEGIVLDVQNNVDDNKNIIQDNVTSLSSTDVAPGNDSVSSGVFDEMIDGNEVVSFIKSDNNSPRAILTSASQISKLRASRETNESLLTAKQFFKTGEGNDHNTDDKQLVGGDSDSSLIEQQSITEEDTNNSKVFPFPVEKTKEEQMEEMMQQITELYNSGKVDEAQALSDKVSELNKELQQNQKLLTA